MGSGAYEWDGQAYEIDTSSLDGMGELPLVNTFTEPDERPHDPAIPFHHATVVPPEGLDPALLEVEADIVWAVVQFWTDDPEDHATDLQDLGIVPVDPLTQTTWLLGVPHTELQNLTARAYVRSVQALEPEAKVHPGLAERVAGGEGRWSSILTFEPVEDLDLQRIRDGVYTAKLDRPLLDRLTHDHRVMWIESVPRDRPTVEETRRVASLDDLAGERVTSLTGEGITVGVIDTGLDFDHPHFDGLRLEKAEDWHEKDRDPQARQGDDHGTHVAGIVTGRHPTDPNVTGMAPDADLVISRIFSRKAWDIADDVWVPDYKETFEDVVTSSTDDVDVIVNSWGHHADDYDWAADDVDEWAHAHPETLVVFANGNPNWTRPGIEAMNSPGLGLNVLAVGAMGEAAEVSSLNELIPPEDVREGSGRVKPDILAVGENVLAPTEGTDYAEKGGTSMAAPAVAGMAALLKEAHPTLDANTLRALLVATTDSVANPKDLPEGHGAANILNALSKNPYESLQATFTGNVEEGEVDEFAFHVPKDAAEIVVTLSWLDPTKGTNIDGRLTYNDLDLWLISPSGESHGQRNDANVKRLDIEDPEPGRWTIRVKGYDVGTNLLVDVVGDQTYAGVARVVTEPPGIAIHGEPAYIKAGLATKTSFPLVIEGTGAPVTGLALSVDSEVVERCETDQGLVGTLARGQQATIEVCVEAVSVGAGVTEVEILSNQGATASVEIPSFIQGGFPLPAVEDVRVPTHDTTIQQGTWSNDPHPTVRWTNPEIYSDRAPPVAYYVVLSGPDELPETLCTAWRHDGIEADFTPVRGQDCPILDQREGGHRISVVPAPGNEVDLQGPRPWLDGTDLSVPSGEWYVHVQPRDATLRFGRTTDAPVGPLRIDVDPPPPSRKSL
ncbi:MAG: S8 family serine peptidase [Candidatus Thermoplasmatota archaeon]|nr:S8 family serine peptidase [Candidatus Thermoplasmatota archaeon]